MIRDLTATDRLPWHKRKQAMLLDNNLGGDLGYAKELLAEIAKLKLWGLGTQFSFNCLHDQEFVDLLVKANVGMAFIGLESLNEPSLRSVHKRQNRVEEYKDLFVQLKRGGILTFTGMIVGLEEDTAAYYRDLPARIEEVDPSAILTSIAIPIVGTPLYKDIDGEGRIVDRDLSHYEGDHLVFQPCHVSPEEIFEAFARINREFYAAPAVARRWWRFMRAMRAPHGLLRWPVDAVVRSAVLLSLSNFQRHHARLRVPVAPKAWAALEQAGATAQARAPWQEERLAS